jgi:type III pantothenate kinase
MLLAIEQGNTNTLFAVHDGDDWIAQWRTATEANRTADEYAVWLSQLLHMHGLSFADLTGCIISSVVPQSIFNLRNLSRRYMNAEPLVIGENAKLGIEVRIAKPSEAGADRLVNAIGAHLVYPGDLLLIDSGTATTFDIVAADGAFEGGLIAPGINLSLQALHEAAAKLPRIAIQKPEHVIGKDTVDVHAIGCLLGLHRPYRRHGRAHESRVGRAAHRRRHGGVASLFEGSTTFIDRFDPDLTIRGLLEIWRRNAT